MRLVLLSGFRYPDGGAGATRSLAAADGLVDAGHEVVFVLTRQQTVPQTVASTRFGWLTTVGSRAGPLGWRVSLAARLARVLATVDSGDDALTALWVVSRDPWTLAVARHVARRLDVPVLHELTEYPDITGAGPWRAWLEGHWLRAELRRLDGLLVISRALRELATGWGTRPLLLTGPMVPLTGAPAPRPSGSTLRIGYAGTVSQAKDGVLDLVGAAVELRRRRPQQALELVLLGEGEDLAQVRQAADAHGLGSSVVLPGAVPPQQVATVLRGCHVLVLARPDSRQARGGFPTKLGEYLATGRPVVATDTGDVGCYVEDRVSCYLVPPGSPEELADALESVLDDPAAAERIGLRGHALCRGSFAALTRARELEAFLDGLPRGRAAARRVRPVIVQHSAGAPGQGGPATALARLMNSDLARHYHFVPITQLGASGGVDLHRIWTWARTIRRVRADVVHVRGLGNEGFHAAVAARLGGARRVLVSVHGSARDLRRPPDRTRALVLAHLLEPLTLLLSTDIVTVCQAMADRAFLRPYRRRLRGVVPNGVELARAEPGERARVRADLGLSAHDVVGVVVGRLSVEKGHLVLADALARRRIPGLTLLVVGDGPDRTEIESAYRRSGTPVLLLGQQADVAPFLAAADLFVFPTLHENLSNALLEAMANGLPVVATAVGGNVEVLREGGGLLVPGGDPDELGSALARVCGDADLRAELGRQARLTVVAHYSMDHMLQAWDQLYVGVLGSRRGASCG